MEASTQIKAKSLEKNDQPGAAAAAALAAAKPRAAAAAAGKSLQSCPTLCNPIDSSSQGSAIPGILQARTLEWFASLCFLIYKMEIVIIPTSQSYCEK